MSQYLLYITLQVITLNEGFVPHPYQLFGVWHIGYGYNLEANEPDPICEDYSCIYWSREHAFEVLSTQVQYKHEQLKTKIICYEVLDVKARSVLLDMAYNMGIRGVTTFKNMVKSLCEFNYKDAAKHLLKSKYAKRLPSRAERNADVLRGIPTL